MRTIAIVSTLAGLLFTARSARADCVNDPQCDGGPVRIMFVIDGSSDLLNAGNAPAPMGATQWDLLRGVLAGPTGSIPSALVDEPSNLVVSQIAHVGVIRFGDPGQEVRVVDYGPCTRPNVEWALDPSTSCDAPGCSDPWGGPEITWTFKDGGEIDPPNFVRETNSTMPECQGNMTCSGSGRAVHSGIELATTNQASYEGSTGFTHDDSTIYINILLVSESYAESSTDMQVQEAIEDAFTAGISTYVIGFGDGAASPSNEFMGQLDGMAGWGSNGTTGPRLAQGGPELHDAIQEIIAELQLPCCYSIDCSGVGGADDGGIGTSAGDDAGDGGEWGGIDGDGSASADDGGDATADGTDGTVDASDTNTEGDEAGFDDDGGCRCANAPATHVPWWLGGIALVRRRRTRWNRAM